ncbi:Uncharacterised protein [Mycobacteroides abscessus subsp. abscessus]|nr:Uncharacterised protein [Mycobacteroides abscessus subsp. abscessus]
MMAAAPMHRISELRKIRSDSPAYQSRPSRTMLTDTVWPRSGSATIRPSASTAAGTSGNSSSFQPACCMRRVASRCEPQIAKAILVSSDGCMEKPATTNQPRAPLDRWPMPGISTSAISTRLTMNAGSAIRRMNAMGSRSAT